MPNLLPYSLRLHTPTPELAMYTIIIETTHIAT